MENSFELRFCCKACGVSWIDHTGVEGTCAELIKVRLALAALMPFVLEDYYETCATPAFRKAAEAAKAISGIK